LEVDSVELSAVVVEALFVWEEDVPEETELVEDCDCPLCCPCVWD